MLVAPILGQMSRDDLNQRYGNSYVKYGGQVQRIIEFISDDGSYHPTSFYIQDQETGRSIEMEFEWSLLDTTRPASRWYTHPRKDKIARESVFFRHGNQRQWHRGFTGNNGSFGRVGLESNYSFLDNLKLAYEQPDFNHGKISIVTQDLIKELGQGDDVQLQDQLVVLSDKGYYGYYPVCYRLNIVGKLTKDGVINMVNNNFEDEIRESIVDAEIKRKSNTVTYAESEGEKFLNKMKTPSQERAQRILAELSQGRPNLRSSWFTQPMTGTTTGRTIATDWDEHPIPFTPPVNPEPIDIARAEDVLDPDLERILSDLDADRARRLNETIVRITAATPRRVDQPIEAPRPRPTRPQRRR